MSQSGPLNGYSGPVPPEIPLQFNADSGSAVSIANIVNLLAQNVSGSGIQTSGSGNTVSHRMLSPYGLGDFTFQNTTASTPRTLQVLNNDTNAASEAILGIKVVSTSNADPYLQVGRNATYNYCWGIDNSDSGTLKICQDANSNAATPSGGTVLYKLTTTGNASYVAGNLDVTRSNGSDVTMSIVNGSGTGKALQLLQVESTNTNDPQTTYTVNGGSSWSVGVDNSNSDVYSISNGTTLGTNECFRISTAFNVTIPSGNLLVQRSNVGGDVTFQTINNDNTNASSDATIQVRSGGSSAGDARVLYTINGVQNWVSGIDNSNNDVFSISLGSTLGTNEFFQISTNGDGTFTTIRNGSSGAYIFKNPNNTASSGANLQIRVAGSAADDPYMRYAVEGVLEWSAGLDNSDSDSYVIAASSVLGTNNVMRASTAGEINYPLQPAFLASLSATQTNVTGDGTTYTIPWNQESFDQNSDFNTGTGTFTAPVAGKYQFNVNVTIVDGSAATDVLVQLIAAGATYNLVRGLAPNNAGDTFSGSILVTMTAASTATVAVTASGTTLTVDVGGGANTPSSFSGYLVA